MNSFFYKLGGEVAAASPVARPAGPTTRPAAAPTPFKQPPLPKPAPDIKLPSASMGGTPGIQATPGVPAMPPAGPFAAAPPPAAVHPGPRPWNTARPSTGPVPPWTPTRNDIEAAGVEHSGEMVSPASILGIRG